MPGLRRAVLRARAAFILTLLVIVAGDAAGLLPVFEFGWPTPVVRAQGDAIDALRDEYAQLEREGLKENFKRQLSYQMLLPYLPPGTRMTSGYRSPEKQLEVIRSFARRLGVATPANMTVEDESSWSGALAAVRSRGIIIAAPTKTPHATSESVFDMAGADLNAIESGLRQAEKAGMVKFTRIIHERANGAIHVEIESFSPKAFDLLGKRGGGSSSQGTTQSTQGTTTTPPVSETDQRRSMLQQLQTLHDSEPDPAKKIDYDRSKKNLLDPSVDAAQLQALNAEIAQHQTELEQLGTQGEKREAINRVSEALREDRLEDAEAEAEKLVEDYPDMREAHNMLRQIKTRRLVNEAMDALYASEEPSCSQCQQADALITEALEISPKHEGAQLIREDVDVCLERCKSKSKYIVVLGILIFLLTASGMALFFLSRAGMLPTVAGLKAPALFAGGDAASHKWVLEGVGGVCKGQTFPLDKPELTIGSQGPPGGTADIVIVDAQRKISRRHCVIMQNGKQFYLIDESTNGTKINDREIPKGAPAEFRKGDRISLGDEAVLLLRPK